MAITTTNNKFRILRGLEANLPTDKVDGYVYVTTDTRSMFVDYTDGGDLKRIRIGDVLTVANVQALPAIAGAAQGVLYYAIAENVLCTPNSANTAWQQINKRYTFSEIVNTFAATAAGADGTSATVQHKITGSDGTNKTATTTIASGNTDTLTVTGTGSTVTINSADTVKTADLSVASNTIKVKNTTSGIGPDGQAITATADEGTTVTFASGGGATVSTNGTTISIAAKPTVAQTFNSAGTLTTTLTHSDSSTTSATVAPQITYGSGTTSTVKFLSGTATLDVYTKAQTDSAIESKLKTANAMTFKGTIAPTGATVTQLPTTNVALGDTYVVSAAGTYGGQVAIIGDMFIAGPGTENASGYLTTVAWTYVPAGNDEQVVLSSSNVTNGRKLVSTVAGAPTTIMQVIAGSGITATNDETTKGLTLAHNAITTTGTNGTAAAVTQTEGTSKTYTAITGITTDGMGHITGFTTATLTVVDTKLTTGSSAVGTTANNVSATILAKDTSQTTSGGSVNFYTTGDSAVSITGDSTNKRIVIETVWSTF